MWGPDLWTRLAALGNIVGTGPCRHLLRASAARWSGLMCASIDRGFSRDVAVVALFLPSLVDCADREALQRTFRAPTSNIRLLVCIFEGSADSVVNALQGLGVEVQYLIA